MLHCLAEGGNGKMVEALLEAKADLGACWASSGECLVAQRQCLVAQRECLVSVLLHNKCLVGTR
jgi:hypothetical protein